MSPYHCPGCGRLVADCLCETPHPRSRRALQQRLSTRQGDAAPVYMDLIRIEGVEFERTEVGSLKIHAPGAKPKYASAAKARDLLTFLLQNFSATGDA